MEQSFEEILNEMLRTRTQDDVARLIGVSSRSINNYLNGETPSKKVKERILEIYTKLSRNETHKNTLDAPLKILLEKALKNEAMNEVIIEMLSEWAARDSGRSVTAVLAEIDKAVQNKFDTLKNQLRYD